MSNLLVIGGVFAGRVFPLGGDEITVGRDAENAIPIPDPALSRRHCAIVRESAGWRVRDLGSSNGTFVNGEQVQSRLIAEGDEIAIGASALMYVNAGADRRGALDAGIQALPPTARLDPAAIECLQRPVHGRNDRATVNGLHVLLTISTNLNAIREETDLFREFLNLVFDAVPAHEGAIVCAAGADELTVLVTRSRGHQSVHVNAAIIRQALSERAGLLWNESPEGSAPRASEATTRSVLAVGIGARGRSNAVLFLSATDHVRFTDEHLQLVTAAGQIAATCLENVRQLVALERAADRLQASLENTHQMIWSSGQMEDVVGRMMKAARSDTTVLICGETGTGKELAAQAIHRNSLRARGPFVAVNCAAIVESLLESELFGHERGAFTGAVAQKKGKLELANGGTLFLDEVGELAPVLQSKLLRVLQERQFERVGGTRPISVDLRLVSATNRDLLAEVEKGRFRRDLYFRLNVIAIRLPPLCQRGGDVQKLAEHFLRVYAPKADRLVNRFSPAALQCLLNYDWPGNVRELENAIERAVVLGSSDEIRVEDLPETLLDASSRLSRAEHSGPTGALHEQVLDLKRRAVIAAFAQCNRSYTEAARLLDVHPNYLHRLIKNLGIKPDLEVLGH